MQALPISTLEQSPTPFVAGGERSSSPLGASGSGLLTIAQERGSSETHTGG